MYKTTGNSWKQQNMYNRTVIARSIYIIQVGMDVHGSSTFCQVM
jgi:hypothetical protein